MFGRLLLYIFLILSFFIQSSNAATEVVLSDQAQVSLLAGKYSKSGSLNVAVDFDMESGWKIYHRTAGDTGFTPMLDWSKSSNIKEMEILWPAPKRHIDEFDGFKAESYTYEDEVVFPLKASVINASEPAEINIEINYGICKDICIPAVANLSYTINPGFYDPADDRKIFESYKKIPKENGSDGLVIGDTTLLRSNDGKAFLSVLAKNIVGLSDDSDMFVEAGNNFAFYKPEVIDLGNNSLEFIFPITFLTDDRLFEGKNILITLKNNDKAVELTLDGSSIKTKPYKKHGEKKDNYSLIVILLFAFIGGLILNVMPCVLPVLSIKLLGIIKHGGGESKNVVMSFIATAIGIIISFIAFAALIIVFRGIGINLGWGFHFQEPAFILFLVVILVLFSANVWGVFEIKLPSFICSFGGCKEGDPGLGGNFLAGVLATLLATPCTAPFLGAAVGFALTKGAFDILVVFSVMGLGMASPYLFFSAFPHLVTKLPKPGDWMIKFKYFLGILLALTAIWLIWVMSNPVGVFAAILFIVLFALKMVKKSINNNLLFALWIIGVISCYLFFSAGYQKENIKAYNGGIIWHEFKAEEISSLVDSGRVVFVDVTADWCLTCKANKFFVLQREGTAKLFNTENVYTMSADWTDKDDSIAEYLRSHNRVGIPFNIIYGPNAKDGIILSELLSIDEIKAAIKTASGE